MTLPRKQQIPLHLKASQFYQSPWCWNKSLRVFKLQACFIGRGTKHEVFQTLAVVVFFFFTLWICQGLQQERSVVSSVVIVRYIMGYDHAYFKRTHVQDRDESRAKGKTDSVLSDGESWLQCETVLAQTPASVSSPLRNHCQGSRGQNIPNTLMLNPSKISFTCNLKPWCHEPYWLDYRVSFPLIIIFQFFIGSPKGVYHTLTIIN